MCLVNLMHTGWTALNVGRVCGFGFRVGVVMLKRTDGQCSNEVWSVHWRVYCTNVATQNLEVTTQQVITRGGQRSGLLGCWVVGLLGCCVAGNGVLLMLLYCHTIWMSTMSHCLSIIAT
jgi:hypothetical protein